MTYDDMGTDESWCTEVAPRPRRDGPTILRTRSFMLNNQAEWGYFGELREPWISDAIKNQGCYDNTHWSDPVFHAC